MATTLETDDPREALANGDVTAKTAAARDLAKVGTVEDVGPLLERVRSDKSPSVRLYAAAGAAEILARHRGAYDQAPLSRDLVRSVLDEVRSVDPRTTPSVLLCYAPFPTPEVLKRLVRMLREPDRTVRSATCAALRRMALSGASTHEGTGVREWVAEALRHPKLPGDVAADLIRLVGEAGWPELLPLVEQGHGVEGALGEATATTVERLHVRSTAAAWEGVWVDEGRDVLQQCEPSTDGAWLAIERSRPTPEGRLELPDGIARRIWAPRVAEEGTHEALQIDGRTYWRLAGKRLLGFVEERDASLADHPDAADWLIADLDEQGGAAALRAAVLVCVRTGRYREAIERLEKPLSGKKPRNDLHFLHGLALLGLERHQAAEAALRTYLEKARAKEPWRAEAEALLPG